MESFERIHRSNLIGMGVLPLQFKPGQDRNGLGLTGTERFDVDGLEAGAKQVTLIVTAEDGSVRSMAVDVRIDTPKEWDYYQHGGILQFVLRQLLADKERAA